MYVYILIYIYTYTQYVDIIFLFFLIQAASPSGHRGRNGYRSDTSNGLKWIW